MICPRCKRRHKWSWSRTGKYDPEWEECDDDDGDIDPSEKVPCDLFHVDVDKRYRCKSCGADRFTVGSGDYQTVIKCTRCGWEDTVHEG